MADTEDAAPRGPKAGGEQQERVKFEDHEDDKLLVSSSSPKQDGAAQSLATNSVDGGTTSSWAPRVDGASTSLTSVPSPQRKVPMKRKASQAEATEPSLTERLGNSALSSTLGILKLAGGVTLSTTGNILSPSLEVTKNILLPNLFAAIADHLSQVSPQRLKDWFRIVSASIHHIIAVIVATERGSIFRHKILRVGGDLVDYCSSDTSRQALMDGMACFVKLNEALHTPEFKNFLEQASVLGCRVVDAAAMDKNKKLIHDWFDLIWSGVELMNDPATTVAFAEVAAYLCHALEMEDAAIHAIAKQREEINRTAAQKRRERDQYQTATYQESYLFRDPNATVEEVILSAFGVIQKSTLRSGEMDNDDIPGSVVLGSEDGGESDRGHSRAVSPTPEAKAGKEVRVKDEDMAKDSDLVVESNDIDVKYLREKITKRAETTKKEHIKTRRSLASIDTVKMRQQLSAITDAFDDGKQDIEELASIAREDTPKHRNDNPLYFEESLDIPAQGDDVQSKDSPREEVPSAPDRQDRSKPMEGETPVAHFYRVLDEVLNDERKKAAGSVLKRTGSSSFEGREAEHGPDTLKRHVQGHRSEKRRSVKGPGTNPVIEKFIKENQMLVCSMVLGALGLGLLFCAFGCYGIYMFAFPPTAYPIPVAMGREALASDGIQLPIVIPDNENSRRKNEYVIRVLREVVHVNAQGETLKIERQTQPNDEL